MISCASGCGGLVRGHRVARPGRTATVWARQYPDGGRSRAPRVDVPNRASRNHPYPCTRATAAASSRGRRCAQKNVLTTRIVQDLRRGKLPSAGDYGDHRRAGQFLYLPRIHPCFVRRAEEGHDPPRKLQPPPTHQHRPRMYMSVEPTVPRGLAMADARPVGQQNRWWRLPVAHREACVSTLQRRSRGSSAGGSPHPRAALQHRVCTRVTAATMCIRVNHVIQNACTSMRRVWLIVQFDRSDTAASVRQGQQWFACRAYWPCACARRRR